MRDTIFTFDITPMGKPRMTQRDKWRNTRTLAADRYFVYKRDLKYLAINIKFKPSDNMKIVFYIPTKSVFSMEELKSLNHQQRPDIDNLVKGFLDSLLENDATVWHIDSYKYWTDKERGRIEVIHL